MKNENKKDLKNKSRASCAEIDMDRMQCNFLADAIKTEIQ